MADMRGLKQKLATALNTARYRTTRRGMTGNGISPNPRDGLLPGFVWVRLSDQRDAVAVRGTVNQVDVPVLVSQDIDGGYFIERLDTEPAVAAFGQSAYQALQPPVTQISSPVDASLIKAGRVRLSEAGGLWIRVEAFAYDNGYFAGGELLLVPTSTVNKRAWVLVYFNPATNSLGQALGVNIDLAVTPLPETIENIVIPDNALPLAAVNLANGQTSIAGSDIHDARYHITKRQKLYYQLVQQSGVGVPQRNALNFTGAGITVTDDPANNRTSIAVTGAGATAGIKRMIGTVLYQTALSSPAPSIGTAPGAIPAGYDYIELTLTNVKSAAAGADDVLYMTFNGDANNANYRQNRIGATASTPSSALSLNRQVFFVPAAAASAAFNSSGIISIGGYDGTTYNKYWHGRLTFQTSTYSYIEVESGTWLSTAAINQIVFTTDGGDNIQSGAELLIVGWKEEYVNGATISTANISTPPTDAELDALFGTPSSVGAGFQVFINDNNLGINFYHIVSDGTNWWYSTFMKAL